MKGKRLTRSVGVSVLFEIRLQNKIQRDGFISTDPKCIYTTRSHWKHKVQSFLTMSFRHYKHKQRHSPWAGCGGYFGWNCQNLHCHRPYGQQLCISLPLGPIGTVAKWPNSQLHSDVPFQNTLQYKPKDRKIILENVVLTSLRRMQCTMTIMNPSRESKTAKRIWKRAERRSVMARTADIQVRASRGRITQELHSDAPARSFSLTSVMPSLDTSLLKTRIPITMFTCSK